MSKSMKHSFSVAASKGATSHEVKVSLPTFAEATNEQRQRMFAEGISGVTIKVQGRLRGQIEKGVRGEALNKFAQQAFDEALDGIRGKSQTVVVVEKKVVDATELELTREQIDIMVSKGYEVRNIPQGV